MTQRLTDAQLATIRQRAVSATEGPWKVGFPGAKVINVYGIDVTNFDEDAQFIANARQDIPLLLAEIDRLRVALEFYADEDNHDYDAAYGKASVLESEVMIDNGSVARQTLNGGANE